MILLQSMKMCFTQPTLSKHYNKKNIFFSVFTSFLKFKYCLFLILRKDRAIEAVARKAKGIVAIVFVMSVARLRATVLPVGPVARDSVPVTQDLTSVLLLCRSTRTSCRI